VCGNERVNQRQRVRFGKKGEGRGRGSSARGAVAWRLPVGDSQVYQNGFGRAVCQGGEKLCAV